MLEPKGCIGLEEPGGEMRGRLRGTEKANKVAQHVKRAAVLTAELAAQSEKKTAAVCDRPPGLDELDWHIEAPNVGAGDSHPQATMMPDPWATYKCPSVSQAKVSNPLSASQDLSSHSGTIRGRQKRSDTRAQEAAPLIDETLNYFVKTTGKDEASMRQQLTGQKREELRRNRDHWKARAEDEERFQKMKEEAWSLFERQPGFKRKTRNELEEEFGRKVRNVMGNSRGEQEKVVQKWSDEMQRAIQPEERRREARERTTMEQEASNSQRQRTWDKLRGPRIPVPSPQPQVAPAVTYF